MTIRPILPAISSSFRAMLVCGLTALLCPGLARSQSAGVPPPHPIEAAFDFDYIHSNAPVAGCGCFSMLGGSASGAYYFGPQFAMVGEFSKTNNDNVDNTSHELTLSTYLLGGRFLFPMRKVRLAPYAQVLLGVARDSGTIAQVTSGGASSYNVFAAGLGGGVDYQLGSRFTLRLARAEYLVSTFPNRANNHQNNFRVTSGIALRF